MKIRIQDNSIRFRVTVREAEALLSEGIIESSTTMISGDSKQCCGKFIYGVMRQDHLDESMCEIKPGSIMILLNSNDCKTLNDPNEEGVYIRQEVKLDHGNIHRFIAFVEKDRPASKCDKPEAWIYDQQAGDAILIGTY